jgi:hypothetical protein
LAKASPEAAQKQRDALAGLGVDVSNLDPILAAATKSQDELSTAQDTGADAAANISLSTQDYIDSLDELDKALHATFDPLFAAADALDKNKDAQDKLTTATYAQAVAQNTFNDAVQKFGPHSDAAVKAYGDLVKANGDLDKAQGDTAKSALDVQLKQDALRTAVANGSVSLDVARYTMQTWVNQGLINQASADAQIAKLAALGMQAAALQNESVIMKILADTGPAYASLNAFLNTVRNSFGMVQLGGSALAREAKAVGGPVAAGQEYLVGERGPELFTPETAGRIVPNNQLARTAANANGGTSGSSRNTYNVTVNGSNLSADQIVAAIKKWEQRNSSAWRN